MSTMYIGPESTPFSRGVTFSDELAEELRAKIAANSEEAGELEAYVLGRIFEEDSAEVAGIYEGMATSPDSRVRAVALDGILNLRSIAPDKATDLIVLLTTDSDDDIRKRAIELNWPE